MSWSYGAVGKRGRSRSLINTSLQVSVGKSFSVFSVPPWCIFFLANLNTETRRSRSLHGEIQFFRRTPTSSIPLEQELAPPSESPEKLFSVCFVPAPWCIFFLANLNTETRRSR